MTGTCVSKMKRSLEEETQITGLFLGNRDIWIGGVFPFLYMFPLSFWMRLQTVSHQWYQMIREGLSELILDLEYENDFVKKCDIIGKRFRGEGLVSLTS